MDDGFLRAAFSNFRHKGKLLLFYAVQLFSKLKLTGAVQFGFVYFHAVCLALITIIFIRLILFLPLGQRPVIGKARDTASLTEVGGLFVVGIKFYRVA